MKNRRPAVFISVLLALTAVLAGLGPAVSPVAAQSWWTNTTASGNFTNNTVVWKGAIPPTASDQANFTNNNTYTVFFTSTPVTSPNGTGYGVFDALNSGNPTLDITGNTWSPGGFDVSFSANTTNTVFLTGGTLAVTNATSSEFNVGRAAKTSGQMTVSNATLLVRAPSVGLLAGSQGTLTVAAGGWVDVAAGTDLNVGNALNATGAVWVTGGQITLTNAGQFLYLGHAGYGQLTVSNGTVQVTNLRMGNNSDAGTLTVAGGTFTMLGTDFEAGATTTGAIWVTGGTLVATNSGVTLNIGGSFGTTAMGQLTVSNGTFLAHSVQLGASAGSVGTLSVAGGVAQLTGSLVTGVNTGTIWVTGGQLIATNTGITVGNGAGNVGQMTVSNATLLVKSLTVGNAAGSRGTLTIAGGTNLVTASLAIASSANATGTVWVTGGQLTVTNASQLLDVGVFGIGQLILSNGLVQATTVRIANNGGQGTLTVAGGTFNILGTGANFDFEIGTTTTGAVWLTGGTLVVTNGATSNIGGSFGGANALGQITVSNGTFLAGAVNAGSSGGGPGSFTVAGGLAQLTGNLTAGPSAKGTVFVTNGGVLEAPGLVVGAAAGSTISNVAGVYQFHTPTPTLTPGTFGNIAINNGTISFRAINNANVASSEGASAALKNISFNGANTFMLNAASNTSAAVSQTYTFDTISGNPSNYASLAMINGTTAYGNANGANITIGSGGSMLVSGTTATISGLFTNLSGGKVTVLNANATFQGKVFNNGGWVSDPSTITYQGDLTIGNNGSLSMAAGDVYSFKSNFFNQSTQSNSYNTLAGKFLFNGTSLTQTFAVAGIDLTAPAVTATSVVGMGMSPPASPDPTVIPAFTNNFSLGTLEIAASSTVRVDDAFINDGKMAALYLSNLVLNANSVLLISTNVEVYFLYSNDWASVGASAQLLNNPTFNDLISGLHEMVVPEPSLLLLCCGGAATIAWLRRRPRK